MHDLLKMSISLSNIAVLNIKGCDYRCIISLISKNEAINLLQNDSLTKKAKDYKMQKYKKFLKAYIKMEKSIW